MSYTRVCLQVSQFALILFVMLGYVMLISILRPFRNNVDDLLEATLQLCLVLILLAGAMIEMDLAVQDITSRPRASDVVLITAVAFAGTISVWAISAQYSQCQSDAGLSAQLESIFDNAAGRQLGLPICKFARPCT